MGTGLIAQCSVGSFHLVKRMGTTHANRVLARRHHRPKGQLEFSLKQIITRRVGFLSYGEIRKKKNLLVWIESQVHTTLCVHWIDE